MPLVSDQIVVVVVLVLSVVAALCVLRLCAIRQRRKVFALLARGELPPLPSPELFKSDRCLASVHMRAWFDQHRQPQSELWIMFFLSAWLGVVIGYFCFLVLGAHALLAFVVGFVGFVLLTNLFCWA